MKYKCTAYKTDEQGRIYAYCGASRIVDGVLYCTHEHGAYCPDYSTERCGSRKRSTKKPKGKSK